MADPHELTALEQADAVRRRQLDPVELVEHHLRRAEAHAGLGAFALLTPDRAIERAREARRAVMAAGDPAELPPLVGVPTGVKDLNLTAGVRTAFGSAVYRDFVPTVDDDVVVALHRAGTVSLGKTSTPEFGLTCYTEPAGQPPAVTPHDPTRTAGGSSGGAATAVAAGLLPVAQGSDGAGSIRVPAACCGVVGLKPTRGRVPRGPLAGDVTGMAVIGPLARTVADAAAMLDAMAVDRPGEPWTAPLPSGGSFLDHARRPPGRLRVGRYARPPVPGAEVAPECLRVWAEATDLLVDLGHEVVDVEPPFPEHAVAAVETVWAVLAHAVPVDPAREDELLPFTRWLRARGSATSAPDFLRALQVTQTVARAAVTAHQAHDVVLTPALAHLPPAVGWFSGSGDPAEDFARQERFTPFTTGYNLTGQPAVVLPLGRTGGSGAGLPVAVQLVGRPAGEAVLLALAAELERARPWPVGPPTPVGGAAT
ncbi:amidase [Streptoalloteichus tenebrarius]|uniref:Amidase n=1 Tax=Streptoalloteichus tenebrarius (strain ATCC 17920 / DSM 40477 / JCM 4838 / CBS 697.72 / NBRC 16177 / NCIMB 11028 / NRRL B-12390 / A12253. 1 / ISP 5477) TaxID=1933 RepID=A0ABT1HW20_STRSD|nr:amidase [Streptoalloteichus tenebrarius]MCP2259727.1 amidase [Streptoalloteichus tenebrarius]BFF00707.1 amidase [Streptoalloteichus tenebrarius]